MSKRIRRDRRKIWVDCKETAKNIEQHCLDKGFVDGLFGEAYTTCHTMNCGTKTKPKWCVIFYCTLDQWNQIAKHYGLIRLNTYEYTYDYELGPSK